MTLIDRLSNIQDGFVAKTRGSLLVTSGKLWRICNLLQNTGPLRTSLFRKIFKFCHVWLFENMIEQSVEVKRWLALFLLYTRVDLTSSLWSLRN